VPPDFDLAVVGSGFGGSILAMIAARLGCRVILLERSGHPRFAIGESASPLAGVILEQLADRYDLPSIRPLATYGEWMRRYPSIMRGLKRGFTYFKQECGHSYRAAADRANQLLVAASPSDDVADTHWLRADVDHFLVREAIALGVAYEDRVSVDAVEWRDDAAALTVSRRGRRDGALPKLTARFVVDASGPHGALSRLLPLDAPGFAEYPATQALYCHFVDVARCADMPEYQHGEQPPYPIDSAALHHVFDEGWMWVLRFDNGVTSAGVAVTDRLAAELRLADGEAAWYRLLARYPSVAAQFAGARPIREFTWMPRLAWRTTVAAGEKWALLPSATAFVDPLFSTGMPLTLLGIERLAAFVTSGFSRTSDLRSYADATLREADHTARFIANCYATLSRFEQFAAYSMFYFVAASWSEMTRRQGLPARGFLCEQDDAFASAMRTVSRPESIARACDRLNIAGLCDPAKRNWYGAEAMV
jgi:FADH2 O2-dependent halogenase